MKRSHLILAAMLAVLPACRKSDDRASVSDAARAVDAAPATRTARPPALPPVTSWQLDPENSSVTFVCKHSGHTNVRGMFQRPSGNVVIDEATPSRSRVDATLEVGLITTGVEERDTHLKSGEFFDLPRFPLITFASTGVSRASDGAYAVTGDLTLHGTTRAVTLAVTVSPPFDHFGSIRRAIEATTTINRTDFGVGAGPWNQPDQTGALVVGDRVAITIDAELVLQAAPGAAP